MCTVSGESLVYKATVNICRANRLPVSRCSLDMKTLIYLLASLLAASADTENISNDLSRDSDCCEQLTSLMCELHLGDIPSCPASSCKEVAAVLSKDRSGLHWLKENNKKFQAYCTPSIPPSESRGWMRVGEVSASQGCPTGLEPVTAGGRKMCRKTVNVGCSSVTFPAQGVSYSKVCGLVYGYKFHSTDGFYRYNCPHCTIDQPYVDGVSITHGHPRQHIWSLAAVNSDPQYCPCASNPTQFSFLPSFISNDDFVCDVASTTTDRLWDSQGCPSSFQQCCERGSWFCKELPESTTDDIEFRLCTDQERANEDVYIQHAELYVY